MTAQVIVVDDDPMVGNLTLELLQEAGLSAGLIQDSFKAQEQIEREQPGLVILDILMPGIDGLTLLHRLKSDPKTASIRVVVVSAKSFEAEKARALSYGATAFIQKPYDVQSFGKRIAELLHAPPDPGQPLPAPKTAAPARRSKVQVCVWGCRSSAPSMGSTGRYGKHTSCVTMELPRHLLIFDAGSGLRPLGETIAREGRFNEFWIFLTHFHKDHVEGLADFIRSRGASSIVNIAGSDRPERTLEQALTDTIGSGGTSSCKIDVYEMREQSYEVLPDVRMTAFYANHPGTTFGYVLHAEGSKIAYCPDSEVYGENATALQDYDEKLGHLVQGADLLIHDGRFAVEDYKANGNAGHSSFLAAVDFAGSNDVKQLMLFHQDGRYGDDVLDAMEKAAEARVAERGYTMKVCVASEGLRLAI